MIRLARESDADQMLEIYAPLVRATAISFELAPPSSTEMRERVRNILATHAWLVCEEAQAICGYAYASKFRAREAYRWAAEVTVYVHPARQRKGVGRTLYRSLFDVMRLQGFCRAIAVIALPNEASVQLHERLGFKSMGVFERAGYKLGRWHDVGWWQLQLQEHPLNPRAPRGVAELVGTAEWERALGAKVTESA
ncbi:MAG TPA: arsinothricin resistance N-acetyltransferase ArsN1 family B [Bryobacteraceae bacterium]|jgi:phosphinothricin acetyltransferase|nr:arsinothricin resistance N-acetyltransferase ArsN1 family B [Bryobacteraceae bacterium]